jgi:hypothetical protein
MINPSWYPTDRQLRQFGMTSLIGFGVVGLVIRLQLDLDVVATVLWVVGGLTFVLGMLKPRLILPIYLGLMALTFPIGWLVTNVLLRIMFYGVMTRKQRTDAENYYRQA